MSTLSIHLDTPREPLEPDGLGAPRWRYATVRVRLDGIEVWSQEWAIYPEDHYDNVCVWVADIPLRALVDLHIRNGHNHAAR